MRVQLPEAEMAGEEQHAAALGVGRAHAVLAVDLDRPAHRLGRQRGEAQQLDQQHAEVLEHPAGDAPALGARCGPESTATGWPAPPGGGARRAGRTRCPARRRAPRAIAAGEQPTNGAHAADGGQLEPLPERLHARAPGRRSARSARNSPITRTTLGEHAPSAGCRAPAAHARSAQGSGAERLEPHGILVGRQDAPGVVRRRPVAPPPPRSCGREPVVIAERRCGGDLPARGREPARRTAPAARCRPRRPRGHPPAARRRALATGSPSPSPRAEAARTP